MPQNVIISPSNSVAAPAPEFSVKYNCKVRYFPDNQIKITCFSKPVFNPLQAEKLQLKPKPPKPSLLEYDAESDSMAYKFVEGKTVYNPFTGKYQPFTLLKMKSENKEIRTDSVKRAIDKAFEIGLANNFQYFVTLTLDKQKIDRYDTEIIYPKLKNWLSNMVSRKNMDYIVFPEYHKQELGHDEQAIHFHGLVNADSLDLVDSGKRTEAGQVIYNLRGWKYGFSTVIKLDGRSAVVRYVTKYITKSNVKILGKFYLSGGKTLKREVPADYMDVDYSSFDGEEYHISAAGMSVKYKTFNLDWENSDKEQ